MTAVAKRQQNRIAKEKRILDAALTIFSQRGFTGASMDAIAEAAGVSKPTLYQYFGDKGQLFSAMLIPQRDSMLDAFHTHADTDMVDQLYQFSWDYADFILRADILSLARLMIGEVQRFPEIGLTYQASGPDRLLASLMKQMLHYRAQDRLQFDDAELAAQDFWGLILSAPRTRALHDIHWRPSRKELARFIDNGLRIFLKGYSTTPDADLAKLEELVGGGA